MRFAAAGIGLLAATLAASVWFVGGVSAIPEPTRLAEDGVGPLRLGQDFADAERQILRAALPAAFSGTGCAGLDEVSYEGWLGGMPVGIMGMAVDGRISEIETTLKTGAQTLDRDQCLALRDRFASAFVERFGPYEASWQVAKPVSREFLARTGPVVVEARWFPAGGSCYVSARFGELPDRIDNASLALNEPVWTESP